MSDDKKLIVAGIELNFDFDESHAAAGIHFSDSWRCRKCAWNLTISYGVYDGTLGGRYAEAMYHHTNCPKSEDDK